MQCVPFSMFGGPGVPSGPPSIQNGRLIHGTENILLKTQASDDFHSEVNLIIYICKIKSQNVCVTPFITQERLYLC